MNDDARDPYVGLNNYFGRKAAGAIPAWYTEGRVLSANPLLIRADGMNLDRDDLLIDPMLGYDYEETLDGLFVDAEGTEVTLSVGRSVGCSAKCSYGSHASITLTDLPGTLSGSVRLKLKSRRLEIGDRVLMIPSKDGQTYFVLRKLVRPDVAVPAD